MPSEQPIRIAIVGAGTNTREKHIPLLKEIAGVTLNGVVNRSEASSRRVAAEFDIPKIYPSWQEAVDDPDIDAIVIGTWPYLHCPVTLRSLDQGKHVLTEARMAMNASEAHQMLAASQRHPHLIAQVVPSPITLGVDQTIKYLLESGSIGTLLTIECRHGGNFYDPAAPLHWRQDVSRSGLNIMAMGIFYEAIMRWVGPASKVTAVGKIFTQSRNDENGMPHEIRVPEHIDVLADIGTNAQLHLQQSAITPLRNEEGIRLTGSDGVLAFHHDVLSIATRDQPEFRSVPIEPNRAGAWRVEEEFIRSIRGEEKVSHTTFEDGVRYMEFTEAVHRSMREGRTITLPLSPVA